MKPIIQVIFAPLLFSSCSGPRPDGGHNSFQTPPAALVNAITNKFAKATIYQAGIDSLISHLKKYEITPENILWGQSTCVDDITNTKNKLMSGIKGPFNFGGLGGLPFTGVTGLNAFAHHVPEEGTAVLFVGPHIGYNEKEGWGKILRHGQSHASSCCGALAAALKKLQDGELKNGEPVREDYQEGIIEQIAFTHQREILSSSVRLLSLTQLTYQEAMKQMTDYASKVKERHFKYAVVVGATIINTDYTYPDYLSIESISILDVQKNSWLEGKRPGGN